MASSYLFRPITSPADGTIPASADPHILSEIPLESGALDREAVPERAWRIMA